MANGQARLAFSLRTIAALLRDIAGFVVDPAPPPAQLQWGRTFALALLVLYLLDSALTFGTVLIWWGADAAGYEAPDLLDWDRSSAEEWISAVLLAPVLEEAIFRGWLSGRQAALELAGRIALAMAVLITGVVLFRSGISLASLRTIQVCALGFTVYALFIWFRERKRKVAIPAWFNRNYCHLVWGSSVAFGTVHLLNYDGLSGPIDLILVLPQTLGGLVLAYTRTRLGLIAAMVQHALFNAVLIATG
jgi:membrane protease YdiL (CAAX protease family)